MVIKVIDDPSTVGVNAAALERLRQWQDDVTDTEVLPFTQLLVSRKGQPVYYHSSGFQDVEAKVPIKDNSISRIFSMTKPIVSVALMMLFEEGKFQLTDPLSIHLGDKWKRKNMRVFSSGDHKNGYGTEKCKTSVTVEMVLTHTSGITYGFDRYGIANKVDPIYFKEKLITKNQHKKTLEEFVDKLAEMPLMFQPGLAWNYGYNVEVVGRLVEVLSGMSIEKYLQEKLFNPLKMVDTSFVIADDKRDRYCKVYMRAGTDAAMVNFNPGKGPRTGLSELSDGGRYSTETTFFEPGGGLVGTIEDYWKFSRMLANGGVWDGKMYLSRKTIEYMTVNHLANDVDLPTMQGYGSDLVTTAPGLGFGLGFAVVLDPAKYKQPASVGTYYWAGAAATLFWIDPAEDIVVVFFTQLLYNDEFLLPLRKILEQLVYGTLEGDHDALRTRLRPLSSRSKM